MISMLEAQLQKLVSRGNPPSISLSVVKKGELVYNRAFGLADGPNQIRANADTVYHWWSLTKVPTAIAILQLHERGKLDINEPVSRYLTYFEVEYPSHARSEITVRQLLKHTSGLADTIPAMIGWIHAEDEIYDQTKLVRQYLPAYKRVKFEPGSKFLYSNLGYMVLGAIIEEITDLTYESYVIENILRPLKMDKTHFLYLPEMQQNQAVGSHPLFNIYTPLLPFLLDMRMLMRERVKGTYWFNRVYIDTTPPSGLIGTAEDAARLMAGLLNGEALISENTKMMMHTKGDRITQRPLGWAEYGEDEHAWFQHRGGGPGFASVMRIYPDNALGMVIFANSTSSIGNHFIEQVSRIPW